MKAKQLLVEVGYPDGFEVTLHVTPVSRSYMFDPPKIAEAIQSYLAAVGIKVKIYPLDWSNFWLEVYGGKHQMCLLGWTGDNGDPDNFMNAGYGADKASIGKAGNKAFYINDQNGFNMLTLFKHDFHAFTFDHIKCTTFSRDIIYYTVRE